MKTDTSVWLVATALGLFLYMFTGHLLLDVAPWGVGLGEIFAISGAKGVVLHVLVAVGYVTCARIGLGVLERGLR